jgi:hypothetical protein
MSLHKFAEQVASQGRGDDSLLVHMTPEEVRNLQQFAQANGTTLTINPTTGLPEAGLLSDLFKSIAPIALGAFLGPAGAAIGGGFMSAGMAGLATGGITALATGSLSRGLMAGLGAYGGAGLGESLMKTGTGALSQSVGAGLSEEAAQQAVASKLAAATPMETLTAGFNSATANPAAMGAFAKNNLTNIGMAAAPIMAGAMVPTTTKLPDPKSTGNIRQMAYNINPDTGRPDPLYGRVEMAPVKASEWGDKTFQGQRDLFYKQNPNPYELGVGSLNQPPQQPPRMNTGGIVALAGGGDAALAAYQAGDYATANRLLGEAGMSAQDVVSKYGLDQAQAADVAKNLAYTGDMSGIKYGTGYVEPAATPTYTQYTPEQISSYLTTNPTADIAADIKTYNADPAAVNAYLASIPDPFRGSTDTTGGSGVLGIYNQMKAQGIDPTELYKAEVANDPKYAGYTQPMIQKAYDLSKGAYALSSQLGGNVSDKDWVKFMDDNKYSIDDAAQAFGLSRNEVKSRYDAVKAAEVKPVTPTPFTSVVPGGTQMPGATVYDNGAFGNYGSGPATGVDYKGNTVSIATPGDIITNTDGTRTVVPNIPGRPYGGFTGMEGVKSAYTAGGGSLGYTAPVPKTPAEHNAAYNKMTDDSLDAYNFLMGKGKNLTQRKAETRDRPVMQRYDEAVLGKKVVRPVAKTTTTDKKEVVAGDTAVIGGIDFDLTDPTKAPAEDNNGPWSWDITSKRWVQYGKMASGGMTGYAVGGGIGSLGSYSDGGRLLRGPGDGVSDSIPATIGRKQQPARLADGEFVIPARIVSELGNGSTDAGAKKLYAMMDRVQRARGKTTGRNKVAANSRADKYLPA